MYPPYGNPKVGNANAIRQCSAEARTLLDSAQRRPSMSYGRSKPDYMKRYYADPVNRERMKESARRRHKRLKNLATVKSPLNTNAEAA